MTANEIAQMVRAEPYHTNLNRNVIADFIDQQADRIAELEKQSEPVGVVCEFEGVLVGTLFKSLPDGTKLYTTPQTKPLSDDEIEIIIEALLMIGFSDSFINYHLKEKALAILRKAQEK